MVNRANGHRANDHRTNGNRADVVAPINLYLFRSVENMPSKGYTELSETR